MTKEQLKDKINALRAELGIGPLPDSAFDKLFMLPSEENNWSWSEQVSFGALPPEGIKVIETIPDPDSWEPTEDSPMLYFKQNYPLPEAPQIIAFDENGTAYSYGTVLYGSVTNRWRIDVIRSSQEEAIDYYFNYGWASEVL